MMVLASHALSHSEADTGHFLANACIWFGLFATVAAVLWVFFVQARSSKTVSSDLLVAKSIADNDNSRLVEDNKLLRRVLVDLARVSNQVQEEYPDMPDVVAKRLRTTLLAAEAILTSH